MGGHSSTQLNAPGSLDEVIRELDPHNRRLLMAVAERLASLQLEGKRNGTLRVRVHGNKAWIYFEVNLGEEQI